MAERQYRIHPAVGIARVGNAVRSDADGGFYFIGPEIPDVPANVDPVSGKLGAFKINGLVKPQAARFYIFEYEKQADGKFHPIGQVTANDASRAVQITWKVHLANRKAGFCRFGGQAGAEDQPLFSTYRANNVHFSLFCGTLSRFPHRLVPRLSRLFRAISRIRVHQWCTEKGDGVPMGTIVARRGRGGAVGYRAQIVRSRRTSAGLTLFRRAKFGSSAGLPPVNDLLTIPTLALPLLFA